MSCCAVFLIVLAFIWYFHSIDSKSFYTQDDSISLFLSLVLHCALHSK